MGEKIKFEIIKSCNESLCIATDSKIIGGAWAGIGETIESFIIDEDKIERIKKLKINVEELAEALEEARIEVAEETAKLYGAELKIEELSAEIAEIRKDK